jgi:hypothetical protein
LYCDESLEGCHLLVLAGAAQLGATVNSNAGAYEVFDYSTTVIIISCRAFSLKYPCRLGCYTICTTTVLHHIELKIYT